MNIFIIFLHKLFTSARRAICFLQNAFVCLQNNFNSCGQIMIKTQKKNFFLRFFSIALISNTGGVVACQRSMLSECFCYILLQEGTAYSSGLQFANFYCTSFKTNIYCDTEESL